jgi:hypothetical protein
MFDEHCNAAAATDYLHRENSPLDCPEKTSRPIEL